MEDYSKKRNKVSTQDGYQGVIDRNIIPLLGRKKVHDVKRPDIAGLMEKLAYKPTEANKTFGVLRKMFNLAEVWGFRPDGTNPCRHVPMYPPGKETRLIVDEEMVRIFRQLEKLEAEGLENYVIPLAIRLQFEFAARRSEICPLEWSWLDFENRRVVWPDSKVGGISKPMSEEAYRLLSTAPRLEGCPYVLPSPNDPAKHLTFGEHYGGWCRTLKAASVPHVGTRHPSSLDHRHCQFRCADQSGNEADGPQDRGDVHALRPHRGQAGARGGRAGGQPPPSHHGRAAAGGGMNGRRPSAASLAAPAALLGDIRALIEAARLRAASTVNSELTMLYWRIGQRIHTQVLDRRRGAYGKEVLPTLAAQLVEEYGSSFAEQNLRRMVQFAATFPDERILVSLIRELSWTHFIALMPLKDPLQRDYYAQMASTQRWSVRTLRERIDSMLYERTALSQKPEETIAQELATLRDAQRMSPALVMRDPYILDFLGLRDTWQEGDLEAAIIREMESFLLELGAGFSFVARQKRIPIDDEDFHLDLLFYNRKLRRLVAVELKVGDFKAAYKGQMELYLRWLDKHEREPEEASPLGIILCTGKKREQIELLELDKSGIHVAEYLTALPPRGVLVERLQQATQRAQLQIEQRKTDNE